ncbi:MAG TPA: hypothetical protein DEQ28_02085 [Clostridiales bacterium]|nr:hypothetical protein [Clostridiales bacterium]
MTKFLRVGFVAERLAEIARAADYAQFLLEIHRSQPGHLPSHKDAAAPDSGPTLDLDAEIRRSLRAIIRLSTETTQFLAQLPCQPLLYTGAEDTDTVIRHLERLLESQPLPSGKPARPQRRGA